MVTIRRIGEIVLRGRHKMPGGRNASDETGAKSPASVPQSTSCGGQSRGDLQRARISEMIDYEFVCIFILRVAICRPEISVAKRIHDGLPLILALDLRTSSNDDQRNDIGQ